MIIGNLLDLLVWLGILVQKSMNASIENWKIRSFTWFMTTFPVYWAVTKRDDSGSSR